MIKNHFYIGILAITIVVISCQPKKIELKDHLDGWEYITTYRILPSHSITFVKRSPEAVLGFAEFVSGKNDVFILRVERRPIFKQGHSLTDLVTFRDLLIELNPNDSIVTPSHLCQSKIYRQIIKMSPFAGAEILKPEEKIEIKKVTLDRWSVISELEDFQFEGEFSFADSSMITNRHRQMLNDE